MRHKQHINCFLLSLPFLSFLSLSSHLLGLEQLFEDIQVSMVGGCGQTVVHLGHALLRVLREAPPPTPGKEDVPGVLNEGERRAGGETRAGVCVCGGGVGKRNAVKMGWGCAEVDVY